MRLVDRVDDCTVDRVSADDRLRREVYSLVRYGSFERGDFVPGRSDLDYFVVVEEDETVVADLERVLRDCASPVSHRGIDLAWEYRENLPDPYDGVPYKFLTVYRDDFRRHHAVVYGADVVAELPDDDVEEHLLPRLERLERLASENRGEPELRYLAGETARMRALLDGADSLRKGDVLAALEAADRTEARRIYGAYVRGCSDELDLDRSHQYVTEEVDRIREELREGSAFEGD